MANEAVLVNKVGAEPVDWIVIDDTVIEKGTIMMISGSSTIGRTALASAGDKVPFAGIARREKIALSGRTRLGLFKNGIFRCRILGSASAGDEMCISGVNSLTKSTNLTVSAAELASIRVGTLLQDATTTQNKQVWIGN